MEYTIQEKEREFWRYLREEAEQFESAIEYDDKSKLSQITCDVLKEVKK